MSTPKFHNQPRPVYHVPEHKLDALRQDPTATMKDYIKLITAHYDVTLPALAERWIRVISNIIEDYRKKRMEIAMDLDKVVGEGLESGIIKEEDAVVKETENFGGYVDSETMSLLNTHSYISVDPSFVPKFDHGGKTWRHPPPNYRILFENLMNVLTSDIRSWDVADAFEWFKRRHVGSAWTAGGPLAVKLAMLDALLLVHEGLIDADAFQEQHGCLSPSEKAAGAKSEQVDRHTALVATASPSNRPGSQEPKPSDEALASDWDMVEKVAPGGSPAPRAGDSTGPRVGESARPRVGESARPRVGECSGPPVGESADPRVDESPGPRVDQSAPPQVGESAPPRLTRFANGGPRLTPFVHR